ncbi:putative acid sphingomyelinase [Ixodes scapularis]
MTRLACFPVLAETTLLVLTTLVCSKDETGFFWHVTDIHYDKDYATHGVRDAMCHLVPNVTGSDDIGPYGDVKCDSPKLLVESAVAAMRSIEPNPDFVLWTGDNLPHLEDVPWSDVYAQIRWLGQRLREEFPGCPVVPTLGNNDCSPPNYMRPDNMSRFLSDAGFRELLPSSSWSTFEKGGYYSWTVSGSLRLVCLNSVLWYTGNPAPAPNPRVDADVGHFELAPGRDQRGLQDLIENFTDVVSGQFFGHQHGNSFVVLSDTDGRPVGSVQVASSVTPWTLPEELYGRLSVPTNPMVRLYKYDRASVRLLDYTIYYLNLERANKRPNETPEWEPLYTLTTQYDVPDASTASMVDLAEKLNNSSELLDTFVWLATALNYSCDSFCRQVQLCSVLHSRAGPHRVCMYSSHWKGQAPSSLATTDRLTSSQGVLIGVVATLISIVCIVLLVYAWRSRRNRAPYTTSNSVKFVCRNLELN